MGILLTTDTTFTAVAGDELTAAGEFVDGQTTVVGTTLTFRHAGLELEIADLLIIQHCGHITVFVMFSGDQSRTESTQIPAMSGRIAWQFAIFSKLRRTASL